MKPKYVVRHLTEYGEDQGGGEVYEDLDTALARYREMVDSQWLEQGAELNLRLARYVTPEMRKWR